jgi:hypothetical protein
MNGRGRAGAGKWAIPALFFKKRTLPTPAWD